MVPYEFYRDTFHGNSIPESEFAALAARAANQLARYKRTYTVTAPDDTAEDMAVCAMADALYYYEAAANGLLVQSASVGSVSSSSAGGALPDMSPRAQSAELYRCAQLYLDIYRGAPRPRFYGSGVRRFSQSENRDEVEEVR